MAFEILGDQLKTSIKSLALITAGALTFVSLSLNVNQQSLAVGSPDSVYSVDQNMEVGFPQSIPPAVTIDFLFNKKNSLKSEAPEFVSANQIINQLSENNNLDFKARQTLFRELKSLGLKTSPEKIRESIRQTRSSDPVSGAAPRIIGGTSATANQVPWQAALVSANSKNLFAGQFCGGSIISRKWILTAAHCVNGSLPNEIDVVTGINNLPSGTSSQNTSKVKQIIVHPDSTDDVALLELTTPLTLTPNRQPIELASSSAPAALVAGDLMTISGWGVVSSFMEQEEIDGEVYEYEVYNYSSSLQVAQTPIVGCPDEWLETDVYGENVCAGSAVPDEQPDSCYGDSGGPLALFSSGKWRLVGVTSYGDSCPPSGVGAYADVRDYAPWIMCHAEVLAPYGGPYFCGDEDGAIDVADTLKVAKGAWGNSQTTITWSADGVAIAAAKNKTSLSLAGRYGKNITVSISSGSTESYDFGTVGEATYIKSFQGKDFVPCTALKVFEPNQGKCSTGVGFSGALQSSPGFAVDKNDPYTGTATGFWAMRDFDLPKGTTQWTWGVGYAQAHGNEALNLGAEYYGGFGSATPTQFGTWGNVYEFPMSSNYLGYTEDETDFENIFWGPINDEENSMSSTLVKGKGRVIFGTYGNENIGSHFTFQFGVVIASYR